MSLLEKKQCFSNQITCLLNQGHPGKEGQSGDKGALVSVKNLQLFDTFVPLRTTEECNRKSMMHSKLLGTKILTLTIAAVLIAAEIAPLKSNCLWSWQNGNWFTHLLEILCRRCELRVALDGALTWHLPVLGLWRLADGCRCIEFLRSPSHHWQWKVISLVMKHRRVLRLLKEFFAQCLPLFMQNRIL